MNICFNGCSLTMGAGFPESQRDIYIYDRLLQKRFGFAHTNIAQGGSSNHNIFMRSAKAISAGYDVVVTQWSALNRIWLYPGPDTCLFSNDHEDEYHYRHIHLDRKTKQKFKDLLALLNHDYHNIIELIDYCSILDQLASLHGTKLVYINGLVPWEADLATPVQTNLGDSLSLYTKEILDFDTRDDQSIIEFFSNLHQKFLELDQKKWVNLFDSFQKCVVDKGPQGHHPGIQSHKIMADKVAEYFINNSILD